MARFTLYIEGEDFSDYIQQETDISEKMRKIIGRAQDVAVDGTTIPDLIAYKWDPSFLLKPMPRSKIAHLITYMEQETVRLRYTSVKQAGTLREIEAIPISMQVKYATENADAERIYDATPIAFEEV